MSEFGELKDDTGPSARQHPDQTRKGEQAVEEAPFHHGRGTAGRRLVLESGLYRVKAMFPAITVMSTTRSPSSSSEHSSKSPDKTTRSASFPARRDPRSRS